MSETQREMPKYNCHKQVWALKIKSVGIRADGSGIITPDEDGYASFAVNARFMDTHQPESGGYFVVYKDGYESYSPAVAFEEGYSLEEKT